MFENISVFGKKATRLNWINVKLVKVRIGRGDSLVAVGKYPSSSRRG
jgi:hypothetical protein